MFGLRWTLGIVGLVRISRIGPAIAVTNSFQIFVGKTGITLSAVALVRFIRDILKIFLFILVLDPVALYHQN